MKKIWSLLCAVMLISVFTFAYAADDITYSVDDISFSGVMGQTMENPSHSCMINVGITKTKAGGESNALVIATYATDGTMVGYSVMTGIFKDGTSANYGTMVNTPEDKTIGVVRAYVWDSVKTMRPLSNVGEKVINQMDPGVIIDDPNQETYIPDSGTVDAMIINTYKTDYALDKNEYGVAYTTAIDVSDEALKNAKTEDEYIYALNRQRETLNYYFGVYGSQYTDKGTFTSQIDLSDYLFQSGRATFAYNDDNELVITDFVPTSGKNEILEFDAADYVMSADLGSDAFHLTNKVKFGTKYYTMNTRVSGSTLAPDITIYANGAECARITTATATEDNLLDKLLGGAQGKIKLVKLENDNGYSKIFVDYYEIAEVATIRSKSDATTINFAVMNGFVGTNANQIVINNDSVEEGGVDVSVKMNGKKIALSDIQEGDIIAIKTDLNNLSTRSVVDPSFVEILVSRDTVTGRLTSINDDDEEVEIDFKPYKAVDYAGLTCNTAKFTVGAIYKLTIDPFGRIFNYEATVSTKNYAVLEKLNSSTDTVTLILSDGTYKAFELAGVGTATKTNAANILDGTAYNAIMGGNQIATATKVAPQYRVVEYTVKQSTGAVSSMTVMPAVNIAAATTSLEYNARTNKIGSYAVAESTRFISTEDYVEKSSNGDYSNGAVSDYKAMSYASLADGEKYDAYFFNKVGTYYGFVLVEKAGEKINASSRFAVVRGSASPSKSVAGDDCYAMKVLCDGAENTLDFDINANVNGSYVSSAAQLSNLLSVGSAFYYRIDSYGLVSDVYVLYDYDSDKSYAAKTGAFAGNVNISGMYDISRWTFGLQNPTKTDMQLAFGVVTGKDANSVELAVMSGDVIDKNIFNSYSGLQGVYSFDFDKNCQTYTYNLCSDDSEKITAGTGISPIKVSNFSLFEDSNDSELIHWGTVNGNNIEDYANYALLMLVDDKVVNAYEIIVNDTEPAEEPDPEPIPQKNLAILEKLNSSNDTVTLVLSDGTHKTFELAGVGSATKTKATEILDGTAYNAIDSTVAVISGGKVAPQYRVVEYTVKSSTGAVSSMTVTAAVNAAAATDLEYNARTGKLGSYAVEDSTKIINTADYVSKKNATTGSYSNGAVGDYKKMAVSSLADGEKYDAYVFNKVGSFYSFVLVEKAGEKVNATSRFAVVRGKATTAVNTDGEQYLKMDVLADGEEKVMALAETVNVNGVAKTYANIAAALNEGSAFFYETDSDGFVSDIYTIYNYQTTNTYAAMTGAYVGDTNITGKYDASKWVFGLQNPTKLDMQLAFGVITNKDNNSVDLAVVTGTTGNEVINKNIADDQNTLQGIYNFRFANDCATYTYDLGDTTSTKLKDKLYAEASSAAVKASTFRLFEDANDSELIHWGTVNGNDINDYANYALVQLVDDEVVAIYEIIR